jgi:DNA-binding CsgD family transcriptional regulator
MMAWRSISSACGVGGPPAGRVEAVIGQLRTVFFWRVGGRFAVRAVASELQAQADKGIEGGRVDLPGDHRDEGGVARYGAGPGRPPLSEREHSVLMAYVSGLTLDSAARRLGISTETARTYLKRVGAKYRRAGLPLYTKLDLARQVRLDCSAGTCSLPRAQAG